MQYFFSYDETIADFNQYHNSKESKSSLQFEHGFGIGDAILFSSYIKNICLLNPTIKYYHYSKNLFEFNKTLYSDISNITILETPKKSIKKISLCFEDVVNHYTWRTLDYKRNQEKEFLIYEDIIRKFGRDYIIIHERSKDNCDREMKLINRQLINNPKNLPIINLDFNWLKKNKINRPHNLLDLRIVLEQASHLHLYEGSIANFADSICTKAISKCIHLYCKPHLFNETLVHNKIIGYLEQGLWFSKNWQVFKTENGLLL